MRRAMVPPPQGRAFLLLVAGALLLAGGCVPLASLIDPPLAQLARWQAEPALAAAQPVVQPCPDSARACPQLHARRAGACMARAMAARAPGAACPGSAARADLDCAMAAYEAARRTDRSPALADGHAQALICAGHLAGDADLGRQALAAAGAAPPDRAALLGRRARSLIATGAAR